MNFEISHEDIKSAFLSVVRSKGVNATDIDFHIKTSRRGGRRSRAIITILAGEAVSAPPMEAPVPPTPDLEVSEVQEEIAEPVVVNAEVHAGEASPFKRLFA